MLKVDSANFRRATAEEVYQAKGNIAWQSLNSLWILCCRVMGTAQVYFYRSNTLAWCTPYPQQFINKFTHWIGMSTSYPFINTIYTFISDTHYISDKKIIEALLKHHRNNDLLEPTRSFTKILEIIQDIFPKDKFLEEDFMLTCHKDHSVIYRDLIHRALTGTSLGNHDITIKNTAEKMLHEWHSKCQQGEQINITEQTRIFASSVIIQLMFNTTKFSREIAESVNFINVYHVKQILRVGNEADKNKYQQSLVIFKEAIEEILKKDDLPLFNFSKEVTESQKKALIFLLFFAGQETTASLLNYMLWEISKNPEKQQEVLSEDKIKNFYHYAINQFTPVYGVIRKLREDTCLEFTLEAETKPRKVIFFKGEQISARIVQLAKMVLNPKNHSAWLPFGSGEHACPGRQLAYREIYLFIEALLENYSIETLQTKPIPIVGFITSQLLEDIYCTIKKNN